MLAEIPQSLVDLGCEGPVDFAACAGVFVDIFEAGGTLGHTGAGCLGFVVEVALVR